MEKIHKISFAYSYNTNKVIITSLSPGEMISIENDVFYYRVHSTLIYLYDTIYNVEPKPNVYNGIAYRYHFRTMDIRVIRIIAILA